MAHSSKPVGGGSEVSGQLEARSEKGVGRKERERVTVSKVFLLATKSLILLRLQWVWLFLTLNLKPCDISQRSMK